jgi:Holliday junction resolvase
MKTPESYEKDEICKYLVSQGAWYFKPFMSGFGKSGVPDIIACIRGRFVSIEVKREGKEPTTHQELRMKEIRDCEGTAVAGTAAVVIKALEKELHELQRADLLGGI